MNEVNSLQISLLVLLGLTVSVGLAIAVWSFVILYKDWNKIYIIKRRRIFVITFLICFCLVEFVYAIPNVWFQYNPNSIAFVIQPYLFQCMTLVGMVSGWTIVFKFWIFYYDSKIIEFENNKEWRMAIDPIKESNNWFVENRNKYGNATYLFKISIVISIFQTSVQIILYHTADAMYSPNRQLYSFCWLFVCITLFSLLGIYICYKIVKHVAMDNLGISKEIAIESISALIVGISDVIMIALIPSEYIRVVFIYYVVLFCMYYMYLTLPYSKKLFDKYQSQPLNLKMKQIEYELAKNINSCSQISPKISPKNSENIIIIDNNSPKKIKTKKYGWRGIVNTYDGYVSFIAHLGKEFSMENLLFVQEVELPLLLFKCTVLCFAYPVCFDCFLFLMRLCIHAVYPD